MDTKPEGVHQPLVLSEDTERPTSNRGDAYARGDQLSHFFQGSGQRPSVEKNKAAEHLINTARVPWQPRNYVIHSFRASARAEGRAADREAAVGRAVVEGNERLACLVGRLMRCLPPEMCSATFSAANVRATASSANQCRSRNRAPAEADATNKKPR